MSLEDLKNSLGEDVLTSMYEYLIPEEDDEMEGFVPAYGKKDVKTCEEILLEFIDALSRADENKEIIMGQVKETVLALNVLNEKCEYELIETDQREDICKLIITAVKVAGLKTDEDVTEEWREW